jgi:hypothetical protein
MPPKRKFIDKKNAVTFRLVNKGGAQDDQKEKVWHVVKSGRVRSQKPFSNLLARQKCKANRKNQKRTSTRHSYDW